MTFVGEENVTVEEGSDAAFPLEHVLVEDLLIRCQGGRELEEKIFSCSIKQRYPHYFHCSDSGNVIRRVHLWAKFATEVR